MIGVIGSDEQIASLLPVVEATLPDDNQSAATSDFRLTSIMLSASSALLGQTPVTASLSTRYGVLLVAVQRGEEYIDSNPNLEFAEGDVLFVAGPAGNLKDIS